MINVLVFCEREPARASFEALFTLSGLRAVLVQSAEEFFAHLERESAEVILLAADDPQDRALDYVFQLRQPGSTYRDIPVVVVFPEDTPLEMTLHSLHQGAYDYLTEPFNEIELLTKVTVLAKIKRAEDEFRRLAIRDVLTGLYDRRYLFLRLDEELSRAKRYSKPISVIALDLDKFAAVNDKYGSEGGDLLLQLVADELSRRKRGIDVLARKENDEFVLVLYNTDLTGATVLANRLLDRLGQIECRFDPAYHAQASLGLAAVETSPELLLHGQELLDWAEQALAQAKREGGARIVAYAPD